MECTEIRKKEPKKSNLSVEDICRILKASEESGILKLKFQDLEFERAPIITATPPLPTHAENAIPEETHKKQNQETLLVDELRQKRQELDEMLITNPAEYERMMTDGELGPVEETDDGDSNE
jgi:hypothetical protein